MLNQFGMVLVRGYFKKAGVKLGDIIAVDIEKQAALKKWAQGLAAHCPD